MTQSSLIDIQAFAKLIEPVTARLEAIEQRLERIEGSLAMPSSPFTNSFRPTRNHLGNPFAKASTSSVPQKRPQGGESSEADLVSKESYQYLALDPSRSEIRILSLTPSPQTTGPIRGDLLRVSLDDLASNTVPSFVQGGFSFGSSRSTHKYKALSYTWGEPDPNRPTSSILIAGAPLRITENLDHALQQLRNEIKPSEQPSYWWIDAICINQDDIEERNSQVALMRRIYGSAMKVRVWLGDEFDDSTEAISLIKKLAHVPPRGPAHPKTAYPDLSDETKLKNLLSVSSLFQRAWWDRVWVRQEIALAYDLSFLCGSASCTLEELTTAERALEDNLLQLRVDTQQEEVAHRLKTIQTKQAGTAERLLELRAESKKGDSYIDFCKLLCHARACKAKDLRDKVFAVLGLADPNVYELPVGYRLPIRDVFLKAATTIFSKTQKLDILSAAQNIDRLHSLPSWAPNLIDPWKAQPFPTGVTIFPIHPLGHAPASWQINPSGKVLTVRGRTYGYIQRLSDQIAKNTHSSHELHQVFCAWKEFATTIWQAKPETNLGIYKFGGQSADFGSEENNHMAKLLLVSNLHSTTEGWNFGTLPQVDHAYSRSFLAPDTWIERRISNPSIQKGMRRYGVGRRVGQCAGKVGLFPEDAREGDIVVYLYGAVNAYVLRRQKGGCLLVGDANFVKAPTSFEIDNKDEDYALF